MPEVNATAAIPFPGARDLVSGIIPVTQTGGSNDPQSIDPSSNGMAFHQQTDVNDTDNVGLLYVGHPYVNLIADTNKFVLLVRFIWDGNLNSDWKRLVSMPTTSGSDEEWSIALTGSQWLGMGMAGEGTTSLSTTITAGVTYWGMSYNDSAERGIRMFTNEGAVIDTATGAVGTVSSSTNDISVGARKANGRCWDGWIIDAFLYYGDVVESKDTWVPELIDNPYQFYKPKLFFLGGSGVSFEQEGYRWRNDDDNEADATWRQNQDIVDTVDKTTNVRLRTLSDTTGDPATKTATLQYKRNDDPITEWRDVT